MTTIYYCLLSVFIDIIYFILLNHPTDQVLFPVLWMRKQVERGQVLVEGHRTNQPISVGHGLNFWFHIQSLFSCPTAVFRVERMRKLCFSGWWQSRYFRNNLSKDLEFV